MTGGNRRIDRILDAGFLDGLTARPLPEVRALRGETEEEEALLSYERRLLHGRMDILRAERERRAGKGGSLLERLPEILADDAIPSRGSMPRGDPPSLDHPRRRVEKLVSDQTLANMADLSDPQLDAIIATLEQAEHEVSEQRKSVLAVLDALTGEIGRRYGSGEANPEDVLTGGA
ncbi:MAG: aerial mycelium formation protein [Actinomycetota bacterium]|nr:aerial mycelium formation protein [Actinomycetota bacterium]